MSTIKTPKNPKVFNCITCNFECFNKKDYSRHLMTAKHIFQHNQQENPKKTPKICRLTCTCGKKYKERSGLWRHKRNCNQINPIITIEDKERVSNDNSIILGVILQNKELMEMLQDQNKIIKEIIPKMGNNNNNHTTNNNQFNLQLFLNDDCKDAINFSEFIEQIQVSFEDLENQAESGYIKGISKLFIENLQNLGINKRPIHCTDKKRKTLYIKENDTWDKEGSQDTLKKGIQEVTKRTFEELIKSKEENNEEYKDADSEFSEKCISIQRNLVPNYPREMTINKVIENITQITGIL